MKIKKTYFGFEKEKELTRRIDRSRILEKLKNGLKTASPMMIIAKTG